MKALFLSRFDSFTKSALAVANEFKKFDIKIDWIFLENITSRNIDYSAYGFVKNTKKLTYSALFKTADFLAYDLIVIYDTGGMIRRICYNLFKLNSERKTDKRPVIITGYPGIIFSEIYTGFSNRALADYVLLSNEYEYEQYKEFCYRSKLTFNGLLWGWNFKPVTLAKEHKTKTFIFADQDIIPKDLADRKYLADQLIKLAIKRPDIDLIIKSRTKKGEKRLFNPEWTIVDLIKSSERDLPKNLKFKWGSIESVLAYADSLITISSTVAIQSLMSGINTVIISDFGINDKNGTQYFMGSGCLKSFRQLAENEKTFPNKLWLDKHIPTTNRDLIVKTICDSINSMSKTIHSSNYPKLYSLDYLSHIYKVKIIDKFIESLISRLIKIFWR